MLFKKFPLLEYPYINSDNTIRRKLVTDIFRRLGFSEDSKNNEEIFTYYRVKDGETAEIIADKVYGSPDYHWAVLLFNDVIDPYYGWTKSSTVLENYMDENYPGTSLYISTTSDSVAELITSGFYLDQTIYKTNGTLQANGEYDIISNTRAVVHGWNKTHCELIVNQNESNFEAGDLIAGIGLSGEALIAKVNRVQRTKDALHHFEKTFTSGSTGETGDVIQINPLSEAAGLSAGENQVIGSTLGFNGTVALKDTGSVTNNNFAVSNYKYELDENIELGRIKILKSDLVRKLPVDFKELINA